MTHPLSDQEIQHDRAAGTLIYNQAILASKQAEVVLNDARRSAAASYESFIETKLICNRSIDSAQCFKVRFESDLEFALAMSASLRNRADNAGANQYAQFADTLRARILEQSEEIERLKVIVMGSKSIHMAAIQDLLDAKSAYMSALDNETQAFEAIGR